MRGKRVRVLLELGVNRIIPAHAGQTIAPRYQQTMCPDHPRACGANRQKKLPTPRQNGSSPRMRGKLRTRRLSGPSPRIIPAHAGQTSWVGMNISSLPDHPRACGANLSMGLPESSVTGSSPRMRGKRQRLPQPRCQRRIIPAHAGQTRALGSSPSFRADHPRACGANKRWARGVPSLRGSSPRMRGKPDLIGAGGPRGRIIPAHAGQTPTAVRFPLFPPDHPRACGANPIFSACRWTHFGSSPRMRGKPRAMNANADRVRIIPAHAGQTLPRNYAESTPTDHPRACGANVRLPVKDRYDAGSSPRMRGKRIIVNYIMRYMRIIPAHAGQTEPQYQQYRRPTDHPRACGANYTLSVII